MSLDHPLHVTPDLPQPHACSGPVATRVAPWRDLLPATPRTTAAPDWLRDGIVRTWDLPADLTEVGLLTVGPRCVSALTVVGGQPFAVTRAAAPVGAAAPAMVESEAAWVAALAATGVVDVPPGLPLPDGRTVATLRDDHGRPWSCVSWTYVGGRSLEELDVDALVPRMRTVGSVTALLHEHALGWTPPVWFRRPTWDLTDLVGPDSRWGPWEGAGLDATDHRLLGTAQEVALGDLSVASRGFMEWGLAHADLRPSKLVVTGDGSSTAHLAGDGGAGLTVTGFGNSGTTWFMYDFAAALSCREHLPQAPALAQQWLEGYLEVRPLTQDDAEVGCALAMIRRLQLLGRVTARGAGVVPPALRESLVEGTVAVAERFLRSGTWLLD